MLPGRALVIGAVAALAFAPVCHADLVGTDAPDFSVPETVNEAPARDLKEMKGEVILIKYWGTN